MKISYIAISVMIALSTGNVLADNIARDNYPLEFADFFTEQPEFIDIVIAGETRGEKVLALVSYEKFKLQDIDSIELTRQYLEKQQVKTAIAKQIIETLQKGIPANPGCEGILSQCIPTDIPGAAEFVFDFDSQQLKIFVSPDMLSTNADTVEYYSAIRSDNALINWSDLYVYSNDSSDNFNWTNNATLGLPVGYLSLDTQYQSYENNLNIYRASYDIEIGGLRGVLGYHGRDTVSFNSTDLLRYGGNYRGYSFSVGTSQNLLKGQTSAQQRIYFYAQQSGQLEVYRGERLLFSRIVSEGKQSIGYDQLPSGVYDITIILKQGTQTLLKETRQIVNTQAFSLGVEKWDYRASVGLLDEQIQNDSHYSIIDTDERLYVQGAATYRPLEELLFSAGIVSTQESSLLQIGGNIAVNSKLSGQYNFGYFPSGATYLYGQINYAPFSVSIEQSKIKDDSLASLLYGPDSSTQWSFGVSAQIFDGYGFLNYYHYETENNWRTSSSDNISASWSRPLLGGDISLSSTYSLYGNDQRNLSTAISWSRKLQDSLTGTTGFYFDDNGFSSNRNNLSYQSRGDNWFGSVTGGTILHQDGGLDATLSANINGNSSYFGYSAYGFTDTMGSRSLSGNISGSQILTSNTFIATKERGEAFVDISPRFEKETSDSVEMKYTILKDDKYWHRNDVKSGESKVISIPPFSDVELVLDTNGNNVDASNDEKRGFVMPGNLYQLKSTLVPLQSQIFILNDMFNKPITSARCIGDGCTTLETLSDDGVFRLNYRQGKPFKLVSSKRLCVYNPDDATKEYINAYCLPGLDEVDGGIVWENNPELIETADIQRALLYIGKYQSTDKAEQILGALKTVGLDSKSIKVGPNLYVYVRYHKEYSIAQRSLLESLDAYVVLDTIDVNHLFTVR